MTSAETAALLGVSTKTVIRLAKAGDIRAVRLGPQGRWRIVRAGVERLVQETPTTAKYGVRHIPAATMRDDDLGGAA